MRTLAMTLLGVLTLAGCEPPHRSSSDKHPLQLIEDWFHARGETMRGQDCKGFNRGLYTCLSGDQQDRRWTCRTTRHGATCAPYMEGDL